MKYEFLDHTADAKFRAYGSNLEQAFQNAALATFSIMLNTNKVAPKIEKQINISAAKKTSLLYDFLEEILFFLDTEGFLLSKVENLKIIEKDNFTLTCTIYGDSFKNYSEVRGNVKSVTYNDMLIDEKEGKVMLQVVVDL